MSIGEVEELAQSIENVAYDEDYIKTQKAILELDNKIDNTNKFSVEILMAEIKELHSNLNKKRPDLAMIFDSEIKSLIAQAYEKKEGFGVIID